MTNKNLRIIPRLDIKGQNLVKGIHLEGFRALGNVNDYIEKYYLEEADEILLNDVVASLYNRNTLFNLIKKITKKIFIPLIAGGGIKSLKDIEFLLSSGADRVFLNSSIIQNPRLLSDAVKYFGSSTIIVSIEAIKSKRKYFCLTNSGREETNLEVNSWIKQVEDMGASEIFLTSVDMDGTGRGFDIKLISQINNLISIPIIISGGYGKTTDIKKILKYKKISAISIGSALHYSSIKNFKYNFNKFDEGNYEFLKSQKKNKFNFTNIKKLRKILDNV
tara:strand:+ start:23042 stop:23872 length:831 start_codon:yes stop_codon:yes gene_type:complete